MDQSDRSAFIPGKLELATLFFMTLVGLTLLNIKQIAAISLGKEGAEFISTETLPTIQHFLLDLLSVITADIATFIFWLAVAFSGIVILDVLRGLLHLYTSDLPHRNLANSDIYSHNKAAIIGHFMVRSVALLGLIAWIVFLFIAALPMSSKLFVEGFSMSPEMYKLPAACILLGVYLYFAGILLKFLTLRKHIF